MRIESRTMTCSFCCVAALLLLRGEAFQSPLNLSRHAIFRNYADSSVLQKMATAEEIEAMRQKAAQLRKEVEEATQSTGGTSSESPSKRSTASAVAAKPLTEKEVLESLSSINFDSANGSDAASQAVKLDELTSSGKLALWKAAVNGSANTSSPAPLRTYPVSNEFLETRTGGQVTGDTLGVTSDSDVSLDDFKDATIAVVLGSSLAGVASLALLPENIGATVCYLIALIPVLFIGIGSTAPGIIAGAIASLRGSADDRAEAERRICSHEAGHFLCGYLCGLPVKSYSVGDNGFPCVEFHPSSDVDAATAKREFTSEEIAALSVVALSGSVAEVLSFGYAKGGENDLIELDNLLRRSKEFVGAQKQQELTRWGALTSYNLIKGNMARYEKLVDAFQSKKSVSECIAVMEATT